MLQYGSWTGEWQLLYGAVRVDAEHVKVSTRCSRHFTCLVGRRGLVLMGMLPMSIQVMFPTEFDWAVGTGIPLSLIEMLLLYVPA